MSKRVVLVGHCSPDSSYLSIAVKSVLPGVWVTRVTDDRSLQAALAGGADLLLVNRVLDGNYKSNDGIALIAELGSTHPQIPAMLISNYADAQKNAIAEGALPGFGKSEINSTKAREALASALGGSKL